MTPNDFSKTLFGFFPKEWTTKRLDEICEISSGSTPHRNEKANFIGDILWVSSGELKSKYLESTHEQISEKAARESNLRLYDAGTVIIAIYGLEAAGIRGTASILEKRSTISQACMAFTDLVEILPEYLYYWYMQNGELIGLRYAQGTKQQNLSVDIVGAFPISFPSPKEQQRIVEILSAQDNIITLKEKLLEEKKQKSRQLAQQLLTDQKQCRGSTCKWQCYRLNQIAKRILVKNVSGNENVLTISAQHGLISQPDFFNKEIASEDKTNYYYIERDDFAYNKSYSNGYPFGAIKRLIRYDTGIVSPLYICFRVNSDRVSVDFLEQYFEAGLLNREIHAYAQEGARNHGLLNIAVEDFFNSRINLPPMEEQIKIAKVLKTADREIELLQASIEQEKQKKKALMQLLLTGIVRV